jgi:hypothetical protein
MRNLNEMGEEKEQASKQYSYEASGEEEGRPKR